jgi:protease-4
MALERAAADRRVRGLFLDVGIGEGGLAQIQEIRDAVMAFRAAGKFAIAFGDTFGELAFGNAAYYLATACEHIVLQPSGELALVGLARESTFIHDALDRIGVDPVFEGRYEYKSAASQLLERAFSDHEREQEQRLVDSQFGQIVAGVAAARGLSEEAVRALVDRAPFLGAEARDAGLVDRRAFRDEAVDAAKERAGDGATLLYLDRYAKQVKKPVGKGKPTTIAVITGVGAIVRRHQPFGLTGTAQIEPDRITALLRKAARDKSVKAIVLRVDSPGGSAVASDTMWREIQRVQGQGKPVVVSMGDVAASGGYYIACTADRIVAHPGTVTGSIGVISGKPVLARAKAKLGMTVDEVHAGEHSRVLSLNRAFTASEHDRFASGLDTIYETFVSHVGDGRHMTRDEVHAVARGRVWTGEDAKELGLIDELGGFPTAFRLARELAGGKAGTPIRLRSYAKKSSFRSMLSSPAGDSSEDPRAAFAGALGDGSLPLGLASAALALLAAGLPLEQVRSALARLGVIERGALHCGLEPADWRIR